MGRRALPKIDPLLDLTPWLLEEEQLPAVLNAWSLFGEQRPLEIEMGSGKGLFLCRATVARPERCFLGLELAPKYARFAAARLARQQTPNGKVAHADGVRVFQQRVADASLAAVHVYFPDPWWKKRHRKRRVMQHAFLQHVERTLVDGGTLHFWTDVEEYYRTTLDLIERVTALKGPHIPPADPAAHDLDYRTHFERRVRLSNAPVYRAEYRKRDR